MKYITLNNGIKMPMLGFGVYQVPEEETKATVTEAIEAGYRSIDTAQVYRNERGVGDAVKASGLLREDFFITSKVWNKFQGYEKTIDSFKRSLEKLQTDYIDLFLVHWPCPDFNLYVETYNALEILYEDGLVKAIGVSNFNIEHLERILAECNVTPVVNQVECHPYHQQEPLKEFCESNNIALESWGPLFKGKDILSDETIIELANKYNKTAAQIVLRWHLETNRIAIPKSVTPTRIKENIDIFDFSLTDEDLSTIKNLNRNTGTGLNPVEMHVV